MIKQKDISTVTKRMWRARQISGKDDVIINAYEANIDLKQDCHERQPVNVFPIKLNEVFLVPVLFALVVITMIGPSQGTLNR